MNKDFNFDTICKLSAKIIILIILLICILNGDKLSDVIYRSHVAEGFNEFEAMQLYISVQLVFLILSFLDIGLIVVDYANLIKKI
jgi:hypothetical protein